MNKIKSLFKMFKRSRIAVIVAGLAVAGVASAALLTIYGHTTSTANVKQSVLFGDNSTTKTYEVGNSDPVAGNVYYDFETLVNNASDKSANIDLQTKYLSSDHSSSWWDTENGIDTSYMNWTTPKEILTGERPSAIYNSTGDKKYEVWYKTSNTNIHYAYYHESGDDWKWDGANTNVNADFDCPFVMKEDGEYYMVNYGSSDSKHFDIYTSDNGIDWTDKGTVYSYTGDWNKIDNPKIIKDGDIYRMYFQMKQSDTDNTKYYIFEAKSTAKSLKKIADNAANSKKSFTTVSGNKTAGSIVEPEAKGKWDSFRVMQPMVFKSGNKGYTMLYTGYDDDKIAKIGYAISNNGVDWTKVKVSKEGYDTTLGTDAWKTSVVKTNNNLVLFYQNGSKIDWTWLTSAVNSDSQMTLQPQEVKPFFIKNDFAINLKPMNYTIQTNINPVGE